MRNNDIAKHSNNKRLGSILLKQMFCLRVSEYKLKKKLKNVFSVNQFFVAPERARAIKAKCENGVRVYEVSAPTQLKKKTW